MPKINSICQNEIESELKHSSFQAEQSHSEQISALTLNETNTFVRPPLVKQFYCGRLKSWVPISLNPDSIGIPDPGQNNPETFAVKGADVDIRPHIFDPILDKHLLCDSGSQVSAFPPEPGDQPLPNLFLKAANGSRMSCYGHKVISVKIGHKDYKFKIIKAQV